MKTIYEPETGSYKIDYSDMLTPAEEIRLKITDAIARDRERKFTQALIELGWTPPENSKGTNEMKITINKQSPERKVLGYLSDGNLILPGQNPNADTVHCLTPSGVIAVWSNTGIEFKQQNVDQYDNPVNPIYEGDEITIKF